jgi:uncharacterized membrane protein
VTSTIVLPRRVFYGLQWLRYSFFLIAFFIGSYLIGKYDPNALSDLLVVLSFLCVGVGIQFVEDYLTKFVK